MSTVGMAALLAVSAVAGCSTAREPAPLEIVRGGPEPVELSMQFWDPAIDGYVSDYVSDYAEAHAAVVAVEAAAVDYGEHHLGLIDALDAGKAVPTLVLIDEYFAGRVMANAERDFAALDGLAPWAVEETFLEWQWDQGRSADGAVTYGIPFQPGGLALCYRADLLEAAGLPHDRDEVALAMGDTWEGFIEFGKRYTAATGSAFIDNATRVYWPATRQLEADHTEVTRDGELDFDNVFGAYRTALDVIEGGISAHIATWGPYWNAGFTNGDFAAVLCPLWMLGYVESLIDAETFSGQWDVTDLPGPGANWGSSHWMVTVGASPEQIKAIRAFLTAVYGFDLGYPALPNPAAGSALRASAEAGWPHVEPNAFFNDAPVGEIYAKSVTDIQGTFYEHPCARAVREVLETVLNEFQGGAGPIWNHYDRGLEYAREAFEDCERSR